MKNSSGPYMQKAGRGNMEGTGRGLPTELTGPKMHEGELHTDPKTTKTQEKVTQGNQTGTRTTFTTKTPGSGGDSLSGEIIRTPEGDAAYAALDQAGRDAQDAKFKASNPRVPGSTNISSRFVPDAQPVTPKGIIPGKANIKAEGIKPTPTRFASTQFEIQADMGGGTQNPSKRRAISNAASGGNNQSPGNTAFSGSSMSTENRTVNLQQAAAVFKAAQTQNNAINEKYSEKNVRAQHAERGGNLERMLKSAHERKDSNQARVNIFKAKN